MKVNVNNASQNQVNKVCLGVMFLVFVVMAAWFMANMWNYSILYK